jgi:hypothetical protein
MPTKKLRKKTSPEVLSKEHLKLAHSFRTQVQPLRQCLFQLHEALFHEPTAAQSFADYLSEGVINQGSGFLKLHKDLYIQALRVLLQQEPVFSPQHKMKGKEYPYPYNLIFRRLKSIGDRVVGRKVTTQIKKTKEYTSDYKIRVVEQASSVESFDPSEDELTRYLPEIRSLLTLVSWPKFVKLELTKEKRDEILSDFCDVITSRLDPKTSYTACLIGESVADWLRSIKVETGDRDITGRRLTAHLISRLPTFGVDLSNRTYKGRKDRVGQIPSRLAYVLKDTLNVNPIYIDTSPVARVSVLPEPGGKTRVITGYNGLINATNAYDIASRVRECIPQDASLDQSSGHRWLAENTKISKITYDRYLVSADLSAFTDNLHFELFLPTLDVLGMHDFGAIAQSPIYVGDKVVSPLRLLMGLKGTFEVASVVHHGLVQTSGISDYVLCGDDLLFADEQLSSYRRYQDKVKGSGLKLNESKTIVSRFGGIFCGEAYFLGHRITPARLPFFTLLAPELSDTQVLRCGGTIIQNVRSAKLTKPFTKILIGSVIALVGRQKRFRRRPLPIELPAKLGGLGGKCAVKGGLLAIISRLKNRMFAMVPRPREEPDCYQTRRYVPYAWGDEPLVIRWTYKNEVHTFSAPNLLVKGGYKRGGRRPSVSEPLLQLKDLLSILEYYYSIGEFA